MASNVRAQSEANDGAGTLKKGVRAVGANVAAFVGLALPVDG